MSTPTSAAGTIAPFVGITLPTSRADPKCSVGHRRDPSMHEGEFARVLELLPRFVLHRDAADPGR
jgi:hypothetical protein